MKLDEEHSQLDLRRLRQKHFQWIQFQVFHLKKKYPFLNNVNGCVDRCTYVYVTWIVMCICMYFNHLHVEDAEIFN